MTPLQKCCCNGGLALHLRVQRFAGGHAGANAGTAVCWRPLRCWSRGSLIAEPRTSRVKARRAFAGTLDGAVFDPERRKSSAAVWVLIFLLASMEPPVERAQGWLTMLSPGAAAIIWQGLHPKWQPNANPFKLVAKEDVAEVSRSVSPLWKGLKIVWFDDNMSALFHSQGVLDCARVRACGGCSLFPSMALRRRAKRQPHVLRLCPLCSAVLRPVIPCGEFEAADLSGHGT